MRRLIPLLIVLLLTSACYAQDPVLTDNLDGSTLGKASGIDYTTGKDGQAVVLDSPTDTIEYPAKYFPPQDGKIEMDFRLTKPLAPDHNTYCLLSDVGAGFAHTGSLIVYWHAGQKQLLYGINSGGWKWCSSKNVEFTPDKWYHLSLTYGPSGMSMEIDGQMQEKNAYTGGLSKTPKRLGFYDGLTHSPPVMVDNIKTYGVLSDHLELSSFVLHPESDGLFDTCTITCGLSSKSTVSLKILKTQKTKLLLAVLSPNGLNDLSKTLKDAMTVRTLIDAKEMDKGEYQQVFDGKGLEDGIYVVELVIKNASGEKKLYDKVRIDSRWKQDNVQWTQDNFFPTGVWFYWDDVTPGKLAKNNDPKKVAEYYDRSCKDLKEHGINLIVFCWIPKVHHKILLDSCQRYGIKALVNTDELTAAINNGSQESQMNLFDTAWNNIKDIKDHPAVYGYYIFDEPSGNYELGLRIARAKQVLEFLDPKHPSFLCLLGGYEQTLQTVDCKVLLIDIYTLWENGNGDMTAYIAELERGKRNAENRPLWIITQAFGKKGSWKIPTPEECRAQTWIALAYGAKGLISFLYQSTPDGEYLQGLVDLNGKPMDGRWPEIARLNADIKKLAPVLTKLKPADFPVPVKSGSVVANAFTDGSDKYVIIASKDTKRSSLVKWEGKSATDVLTGVSTGSAITLEPGGGRLLKLR